jgi:DME family drug/metabolite transporter
MSGSVPSIAGARLCLILAAVLWSLGSLFMRVLREPTALGLDEPRLAPIPIAFFRALFAGLVMVPLIRRADVKFRPLMGGMVVTFAAMSGLYLSALGLGPAANAIFLQNTAPFWVYLFAVVVLREAVERRAAQAVLLGAAGATVIVAGNWPRDVPPEPQTAQVAVLFMGLGSGVVYAGVILFLRALRDSSAAWLVFLNHIGSAMALGLFLVLAPAAWSGWADWPTARQLAVLAVFGACQMAIPYWLFTRGLKTVGAHEAAIITLLEPLLNPVWAYLITPEKDTPNGPMYIGGALILTALVWRYIPTRGPVVRPSATAIAEEEEVEKEGHP